MSLLRNKPTPEGVAELAYYGDEEGELFGVRPEWSGNPATLVHLPSMIWDEFLAFLRYDQDEALDEFGHFVSAAQHWRGDHSLLLFSLPRLSILEARPPTSPADGVAVVSAYMDYSAQRHYVESTFTPKDSRPLLFTLTPRIIWDWVFRLLVAEGADGEIDALLTNLAYQLEYYEHRGVASDFRLKNIGKAPFYGAMSDNRDRLIAEVAEFGGITPEEFSHLGERERDELMRAHTAAHSDEIAAELLDHLKSRESP